jgi:two-component system, NtrC family, sensor kinase
MPVEEPEMPTLAQLVRRPAAIVWGLALFAMALALIILGLPSITPTRLAGALLIGALILLGDWAAVPLEDGGALSPVPALLIAGLSVTGWPLLPVAVLVAASATMLANRSISEPAIRLAGARALVVALIAVVYRLTESPLIAPYSTPLGLIGLLVMGALAYAIMLVAGTPGVERRLLLARWQGATRWYTLAMIPLGGLLGALWWVSSWAFLLGLAPLAVMQHAFREQVALRQTTADFAHLAVQRESLTTRLERLQALATTMIGTLDVQAMLELLRERLAALLEADYGWVVLREADGRPKLIAGKCSTTTEERPPALNRPQSYAPLFERGVVMLIADERLFGLAPTTSDSSRWASVLSIPLIGEQAVLGTICLAFERLRGLDADEPRVLTSFARQAATVIENARLFDELHRKQAELIQSSKLAAVGTFAAGIAHEFNNLLAGMLGHAELGYRIDDAEEKNHSLDIVIQSCRRGRSITQGLLTFARRQEHRRQLADLIDAIGETMMLVELDLCKSNIEVIRQIEPVPPTVCDVGQLSQVVLNLVTNARDAMKPDGGTLTIGLRERDDMIELSIADTGSGIAEHIRDKIFEPFITTKGALGGSQTPGTGLGLSVSYGIVREHGGEIIVESEVGRGTRMTVRLPVVAEATEQEVAVGEC